MVVRVILVLICSTCVLADYYYDYYGPYSWEDDSGDDDGEGGSGSGSGPESGGGGKRNGNCGNWRWTSHNGFCYRFQNDYFKNWEQAQAECRKDGAELLSISDKKEFEYVAIQTKALDWVAPRQPVWIGLVQENGQYSWTDGTPFTFTHWRKGEPNDYKHCSKTYTAMYKQDGGWVDVDCKFREKPVDSPAGYVCKKPEPVVKET